jgi:hypothetical protein
MKKARKGAKNPNPGKVSPFLFGTCAIFIPQKAREWQPKKNGEKTLAKRIYAYYTICRSCGNRKIPFMP